MNPIKRQLAPFLPGPDNPKVTDGELAVFIVCVLVTTVGLAGDISRHLQDPGSLQNDFVSGWHLVLYGGVLAVGVFIGVGAIRRGPGYVGAVSTGTIGFGLLSLGGVCDAAWHAKFGTEAAVEALVSPPHLVVFSGLAFLLTAPVVVLWKREARRLGLVASVAAMVSVVSTVLVTSLFTGYLSPLSGGLSLQAGYVEPLVGQSFQDYDTVRGLGIAVWTAAVLATAVVILLVRFRLVPGVLLVGFVLLGLPPLFVNGAGGIGDTSSIDVFNPLTVGFVAAGLAAEVCMVLLGRPTLGRIGASVTGAAVGASMWAATFAVLGHDDQLRWGEALWGGAITIAGLVGAAVAALIALPVSTGPSIASGTPGPRPV